MATASRTSSTPSYCSKAYQFYNLHSDIISAYWRLALYTNVLAHKVFRSFPPKVAHLSQAGLSYCGVIYINLTVRELQKSFNINVSNLFNFKFSEVIQGDFRTFYDNGNRLGMLITAAKVTYQAIDIILVAGGFVVSIAAILGHAPLLASFYVFMRPYTVTSLALSAISQVSDYLINQKLVNETMPDRNLWIRAQLGTWDRKRLEDEPGLNINDLIRHKLTCTRNRLGIMGTDYVLLTVCALKPNTALNAALMWGRSIVAIIMLHHEKFGKVSSAG